MTHLITLIKKQLSAAMFGIFLLFLIVLSHRFYPNQSPLPRYDFMLFCALCFQAGLLYFRLESKKEAMVILVFHILAMCMEIFKVREGSWVYPDAFMLGILGVPLFAGFMYSAVGSYLVRLHGQFRIVYQHLPQPQALLLLSALCYANFFTHHYIADARWLLTAASFWLLWRTQVSVQVATSRYSLPVLMPLLVVAVLIWLAENMATYSRVWLYPNQIAAWQMVSLSKISSWYLLLLLSFALIVVVHTRQAND